MPICNDSPNIVLIFRKHRLGTVTKVLYENYFQVVHNLEVAKVPSRLIFDQFNYRAIAISSVNLYLKIKLLNSIMIYGDKQAVYKIVTLVVKFQTV